MVENRAIPALWVDGQFAEKEVVVDHGLQASNPRDEK
jgi:hypothetical protein